MALLMPARVVGVLTALIGELGSSFTDPITTAVDRTRIREEAHALSSAAGMIGFRDLSIACHTLQECTEERGLEVFRDILINIRDLSAASIFKARLIAAAQAEIFQILRSSIGNASNIFLLQRIN